MHFKSLKYFSYRNIKTSQIQLSPVLNIFLGKNAQGKTNILESIFLLLNGKTFRPAKAIHIINKDTHNSICAIGGEFVDKSVQNVIELQIKENLKHHFLNRKRISSAKIQKNYPCILFSPESLMAIKSGPESRRVLLDDWLPLFDARALKLLQDFSKCLRTRNKILRDYKAEKIYLDEFDGVFESINKTYYRLASELTMLRIESIRSIQPLFERIMSRISNRKAKVAIRYLVSDEDITLEKQDIIATKLAKRAKELRFAEISSASSLFGPHKHDLQIFLDGNDSRYFSSQGQQRALILSFKIAQIVYYNARYGVFPLLLLDDVLSELDEEKRSFLLEFLKESKAQTFISTTEMNFESLLKGQAVKIFHLDDGNITDEISQHRSETGEQNL